MNRGIIYRLRALIADHFGIQSNEAADGAWWEVDMLLVIWAGAFVLALSGLTQM